MASLTATDILAAADAAALADPKLLGSINVAEEAAADKQRSALKIKPPPSSKPLIKDPSKPDALGIVALAATLTAVVGTSTDTAIPARPTAKRCMDPAFPEPCWNGECKADRKECPCHPRTPIKCSPGKCVAVAAWCKTCPEQQAVAMPEHTHHSAENITAMMTVPLFQCETGQCVRNAKHCPCSVWQVRCPGPEALCMDKIEQCPKPADTPEAIEHKQFTERAQRLLDGKVDVFASTAQIWQDRRLNSVNSAGVCCGVTRDSLTYCSNGDGNPETCGLAGDCFFNSTATECYYPPLPATTMQPACPLEMPVRCEDGACVMGKEMCPCPVDQFSGQRQHRCIDGTCVRLKKNCILPPACVEPLPHTCPSGACVKSAADCPTPAQCPFGEVMCGDGSCAPTLVTGDNLCGLGSCPFLPGWDESDAHYEARLNASSGHDMAPHHPPRSPCRAESPCMPKEMGGKGPGSEACLLEVQAYCGASMAHDPGCNFPAVKAILHEFEHYQEVGPLHVNMTSHQTGAGTKPETPAMPSAKQRRLAESKHHQARLHKEFFRNHRRRLVGLEHEEQREVHMLLISALHQRWRHATGTPHGRRLTSGKVPAAKKTLLCAD
jgi:hypothetical protein